MSDGRGCRVVWFRHTARATYSSRHQPRLTRIGNFHSRAQGVRHHQTSSNIETPAQITMSGAREGLRLANVLKSSRTLQRRSTQLCHQRFASTAAAQSAPSNALSDLEAESSFATPGPDDATVKKFSPQANASGRTEQLPGNR